MPPKRATTVKKTKKVVNSDSESEQSESSEDYDDDAEEEEDDEDDDDEEDEAEDEEEALDEAEETSRGDFVGDSSDSESDSEKAPPRKSMLAPKRKATAPSEPVKKTKRVAAPSPSERSLEESSSTSSSSSSSTSTKNSKDNIGSNCGSSRSSSTPVGPSSSRSTKNIPKASAATKDDDEPEPEEQDNDNDNKPGDGDDGGVEKGDGGATGSGGASEGGEENKKKKKKTVSNELKAKMRGDGPASKILAVMYNINRPGNVTSVEGWTGHKIPKGIVQNSLEELAKSGELSVTGKTGKVYWFNQNQFRTKGLDLIKLTKKVEEQNETLAKLKEEHGALAKEMRNLEAKPTDDDLPGTVQELVDRRDALTAKVATLRSSSVAMTPAQKEKQRKQFMLYRDAWSKRKRYCQDACGAVADGMDKKLKDIESLIGIETDDDAGHQVPPLSALGVSNRPVITMRTTKGAKKR